MGWGLGIPTRELFGERDPRAVHVGGRPCRGANGTFRGGVFGFCDNLLLQLAARDQTCDRIVHATYGSTRN